MGGNEDHHRRNSRPSSAIDFLKRDLNTAQTKLDQAQHENQLLHGQNNKLTEDYQKLLETGKAFENEAKTRGALAKQLEDELRVARNRLLEFEQIIAAATMSTDGAAGGQNPPPPQHQSILNPTPQHQSILNPQPQQNQATAFQPVNPADPNAAARQPNPPPGDQMVYDQDQQFFGQLRPEILKGLGIKYPTFNQDAGEDWLSFRRNFENVAQVYGHPTSLVKKILVACMGKQACNTVLDIQSQNYTSFASLLDAYEERFMPTQSTAFAQTKYDNAVQQKLEPIQVYHNRLRDLFRRAFPARRDAWHTEKVLIKKFALGLRNQSAKVQIIRSECATYQDALRIAQREQGVLETLTHDPSRRRGPHVPSMDQGDPMEIDALNDFITEPSDSSLTTNSSFSFSEDGTTSVLAIRETNCKLCNQPGHYVVSCPKLPAAQKWLAGQQQQSTWRGRGNAYRSIITGRTINQPGFGRGAGNYQGSSWNSYRGRGLGAGPNRGQLGPPRGRAFSRGRGETRFSRLVAELAGPDADEDHSPDAQECDEADDGGNPYVAGDPDEYDSQDTQGQGDYQDFHLR